MPVIQRKRPAQHDPEEDDESPEASPTPPAQRRRTTDGHAGGEEDGNFAGDGGATQDTSNDEMARKLVRLALSCEFQRRPIRRQDILDKVLGANSRAFKGVFSQAQLHLNSTFGMELVALPARETVTLQQRRAAQKKESQSKGTTTAWILKSLLPSGYHDPLILQPPSAPTPSEEGKYTAVYSILVSAILLSGGSLPEAKMERFLRKLHIDDVTPVAEYEKTEKLMKRLEKDGYMIRIKESSGTGEDDIYWVVGPRGKIEVGEDGVRGLTKAVWGELDEEEDLELDRKVERSLGIADRPERKEKSQRPNGENGGRKKTKRKSRSAPEEEDEDEEEEDEDD